MGFILVVAVSLKLDWEEEEDVEGLSKRVEGDGESWLREMGGEGRGEGQ